MFHDTFNDLFASLFRGDLRLVSIGTHTVVSVVPFNSALYKSSQNGGHDAGIYVVSLDFF